jgi:hypothetical protein
MILEGAFVARWFVQEETRPADTFLRESAMWKNMMTFMEDK